MVAADTARPRSQREHVGAVLADREHVSHAQEATVRFAGNFFLQACPGSGKTRTIGLRMAWASVDGQGRTLAAASYTNTAVAEIERAAADAGVPIAQPHWVGTIHSFLITYVLAPFAPRILGCKRPPRIVAEEFQRPATKQLWWDKKKPPVDPWDFEFKADGDVVHNPAGFSRLPKEVVEHLQEPVKKAKAELGARGFVSQSDAVYYAMRLLEENRDLAAAVAARFDELIVDEFQDTNPVQLRCLELLSETGELDSLVLCGDLDQAIYSFTGADPGKCEKFAAALGLETLTLSENYRSSQAICDVVPCFSARRSADIARGGNNGFGVSPEVLMYSREDCPALLGTFGSRLATLDLDPSGAVVLVRRHDFKQELNGNESLNTPRAMDVLGRACARFQGGGTLAGATVRALDSLLASIAFEDPSTAMEDGESAASVRAATMALLEGTPDLDSALPDWIDGLRDVAKDALTGLEPLHRKVGDRVRRFKNCESYTARQVFGGALDDVLEAEVIHRVKGESHDAVLLVAQPGKGKHDNARLWIEASKTGEVTEEVRVAYVALTRARRYCAVALPDDCAPEVADRFRQAGFEFVHDPAAAPERKPYEEPGEPSHGDLAAKLDPAAVAEALERWTRRSRVQREAWSRWLCERMRPGTVARAAGWRVRECADVAPEYPDDRLQPAWYALQFTVEADLELLDDAGEPAVQETVADHEVPARVRLSLHVLPANEVGVVVHELDLLPAGLEPAG